MRQVMYVSDSLVGSDVQALERLIVQARTNNALDGITGLLWTDGAQFAQVVEGSPSAVTDLMAKLHRDVRHTALQAVSDIETTDRQYGAWAMAQPAFDVMAAECERRIRAQLTWLRSDLSGSFEGVVERARRFS